MQEKEYKRLISGLTTARWIAQVSCYGILAYAMFIMPPNPTERRQVIAAAVILAIIAVIAEWTVKRVRKIREEYSSKT